MWDLRSVEHDADAWQHLPDWQQLREGLLREQDEAAADRLIGNLRRVLESLPASRDASVPPLWLDNVEGVVWISINGAPRVHVSTAAGYANAVAELIQLLLREIPREEP
jgi:hypothetical protein